MSDTLNGFQHIVLSRVEVRKLTCSMVYILKEKGVIQFIGGSKFGLARFADPKFVNKYSWDEVQIIFCNPEELNALQLKLEYELSPVIKNRTKNAGTTWEPLNDLKERRQEEIVEERYRQEALEKLTEEALKQQWRMK